MNIEPRNLDLVITVTPEEQAQLREYRELDPDNFGTSQHEVDFLENYLANSEYDWVDPMYTGDLTDAPMLGITGEDEYADVERKFKFPVRTKVSKLIEDFAEAKKQVRTFFGRNGY